MDKINWKSVALLIVEEEISDHTAVYISNCLIDALLTDIVM